MFLYKVAILLTGGRQSPDGGSLHEAMRTLRNLDVTTYVIAIGAQSDVPVEQPENVLTVTSYSDLAQQVQPIARSITKRRGMYCTSKGKFMVLRLSIVFLEKVNENIALRGETNYTKRQLVSLGTVNEVHC